MCMCVTPSFRYSCESKTKAVARERAQARAALRPAGPAPTMSRSKIWGRGRSAMMSVLELCLEIYWM